MNILELEKYKREGIIEAYCMGTLSNEKSSKISMLASENIELKKEIDLTLETLSSLKTNTPNTELRLQILGTLDELMEPAVIDILNPPFINKYSDASAWSKSLSHVTDIEIEDGIGIHSIVDKDELQLNVVWLYNSLIEEGHDEKDFHESFLILEGSCECDFEGDIYQFKAGDYFDIPIGVKHIIKNTSTGISYVKGLVQRKKIAV